MGFIRVKDRHGSTHVLEAVEGWRLMEVIRGHGLPIEATCGGACACATCHVYVDPAWAGQLPEREEMEQSMLDFAAAPLQETSRLSCQLKVTPEMDGLVVRMPKSQH